MIAAMDLRLPLLVAVLATVGLPAAAQPDAPTNLPGVVVEGRRPEDVAAARARIDQFVRLRVAPVARTGQMARWRSPVCAHAMGLTPELDDFVARRVEALAAEVGAPVRKPGQPCRVNVEVIFTAEPQELLDAIAERTPKMLGFHYAAQRKRLAAFHPPIQGWYATATGGTSGEERLDEPFAPPPAGAPGSRLSNRISSSIVAAVVVGDSKAVAGRTIGQVADYVAVSALSLPGATRTCAALPSILDLGSGPCAERATAITAADASFLKALYKVDMEAILNLQRGGIAARMKRDPDGPTAP